MKTLVFIGLFCFLSIISYSQLRVYITGSQFEAYTNNSSKLGGGLGVSFGHIYLDFASNFASGKGEHLEFSSGYTYDSKKMSVSVINAGYQFKLLKWLCLTPTIGYSSTKKIYQDPIGWNTYYLSKTESNANFGAFATVFASRKIGFSFGYGNIERYKCQLVFNWN